MNAIGSYIAIVVIWATTPLAIKWSSSSLSFSAAAMLRIVPATLFCVLILSVLRRPLVTSARDWKAFLVGAIGLYPMMLITYWSAQFISSLKNHVLRTWS